MADQMSTHLRVGSGQGNNTTLAAQVGAVATGITSNDSGLAVAGDEAGGSEDDDGGLGEHLERLLGGWNISHCEIIKKKR